MIIDDLNALMHLFSISMRVQILCTQVQIANYAQLCLFPFSNRPGVVKDSVFVCLSQDEDVVNKFRNQSARDWERFLECRAKELISGITVIYLHELNQ